jgi:outer membrane protein OmpA-like peptidoglycan-associated protein
MLRSVLILRALTVGVLVAAAGPAFAEPKDKPQCVGKEHPLFTRMPGWLLYSCEEKQFERGVFTVMDERNRAVNKAVEGHYYGYYYYPYVGEGPKPSGLQIARNYANAAKASGGEVLFTNNGSATVRFTKGGKQTWAKAWEGGSGLNLMIVEVEEMKQDITANADALKGGLAANGHVELTGIFFDTGKSELKPESGPALEEVTKLLKAQPQLVLWVVGHTDSAGNLDSNLALSQARAASVIQSLVQQHGIGPQRLAPFGAGPYAPVATNATEEGRAKNRRVELVVR